MYVQGPLQKKLETGFSLGLHSNFQDYKINLYTLNVIKFYFNDYSDANNKNKTKCIFHKFKATFLEWVPVTVCFSCAYP